MKFLRSTQHTERAAEDRIFVNRALEAAIRIGLIALLVAFCFLIVKAFIPTLLWGVIIAIGIFPIHRKLAVALGQREKLAALVLTLCALVLLVVLVILIGAVGGMMAYGIIGLFVGPVLFAIGYKLFLAWLNDDFLGRAPGAAFQGPGKYLNGN